MEKIKEKYHWYCDCLFGTTDDPDDWFVDDVTCNKCGFYLSGIDRVVGHPIKYCPGCGGLIEGVVNPNPPID